MPDSLFKRIWDPIIIGCLLYTATISPYQVAFVQADEVTIGQHLINILIDIFFIVDLILTFYTPFKKYDETFEMNRKKITTHYIKSTFVIDLLACLPTEFFEFFITEE